MVNNKTIFTFTCGCKFAVVLHAGLQGSRIFACKGHVGKVTKGDVEDLNKLLPLQLKSVSDDSEKARGLVLQGNVLVPREQVIGRNLSGTTTPKVNKGALETPVKPISDAEAARLFEGA